MAPKIGEIQAAIEKQGLLASSRSIYIQRNVARFGPKTVLPASKTIATKLAPIGAPKPKSTLITIGEAPDGFGKVVVWNPDDKEIAVVAFLNAGDSSGVMISGAKPTDTIEIVNATGIASFAEETENDGVPSFIGIVAAGGVITATAFGTPELIPVIEAATAFAKDRFKEKKVKTKRRDPFGEDPGNGDKARQEGGVIVSLPEARRIFYSGNSDHEERWIKKPGTRDAEHIPDHVSNAFFLQGNTDNKYKTSANGDFIIAPWDYKFEDNFGFYRLDVLLKRGDGTLPDVE